MAKRYKITEAAYGAVSETHGHSFAMSVLAVVDVCRGYRTFAPVGADGPIMSEASALFDDQVEEAG
jgi:hypothetical protein